MSKPLPAPSNIDYPRSQDDLHRSLQRAYERLNSLQKQLGTIPVESLSAGQMTQVKGLVGETASSALSAGGSNPIPITTIAGANTYVSPAVSTAITTGASTAVTSAILSGTHATRPAAASLTPPALYFETDRTVNYELISAAWVYTDGIMFAPLASRPADLTTSDSGFLFHATGNNLTYQWSGSAWAILITRQPVIADTFASWTTANYNPSLYASGQQFLVTDRNVTYTVLSGAWHYTSGQYVAPTASRPATGFNGAALGVNDTGLEFVDSTLNILQYWTGTLWQTIPVTVAGAPALAAQLVYATGSLALVAGTPNNVPGAVITASAAGTYLVTGIFDFLCTGADTTAQFFGYLSATSVSQTPLAVFVPEVSGARAMISQQWMVAVSAGATLQLMADKAAGTGTSQCIGGFSTTMISVIRVA
jgi:hypothetical protein